MYLAAGVYLSEAPDLLPPPLLTVWIHTPVFIHIGGGGDRWTRQKVRGALVHKRGRKYQHDWLYLQSINSIKLYWTPVSRYLEFGVFKDIWSLGGYKQTTGKMWRNILSLQ